METVAAERASLDPLGAGALLTGVLFGCVGIGALVGYAAGSVGIAGEQTGIYPYDTPGGWRIIGWTATKVFDASRAEPFLLKAGDYVTFVVA